MNFRLSRLGAFALSLLSAGALATTITGKVTDEGGNPIEGAEVSVEGSRQVVLTDAQGRYRLENLVQQDIHVHVSSDNYLHGDEDLGSVEQDRELNFTLFPSSVENVLVTATAMQTSVLESVTPVSVIGAETLKKNQAPTLGETLKTTPGVHSTYFGPVSSSPVIRGNDGPRVMVVKNGLSVSDVSRIGPDHNVAADTSSAVQVEVLRGPATLQYGSGAIGGVVNVVDRRIPQTVPQQAEGEAEVRYSTVDNGRFGKVDVTGGQGSVAYHFDGFARDTDNADIPGYASVEPDGDEPAGDEPAGVLEHSAMETTDFNAGLSYVQDEGYIGFAIEKLDNLYGVPGHSHHHEDEAHDEEEHDEEGHENGTRLDVDMTRYQTAGEWHSPMRGISNVKFAAAYTDYSHTELEGDEVGTIFNNKSTDARLAIYHTGVEGWHGVVGLQGTRGDYEAIGEEAFTPQTDTTNYALFLIEQKKIGDVTLELGGRIDRTEYDVADAELALETGHEDHDEEHEDEHEDDHEGDEHDEAHLFSFGEYTFTSTSFSAGANWEYQPGYAAALTLSRNERAPSQQELFAGGQHLATQTYELGLVYQLNDEGEISDTLNDVQEEVSNNLDLTFRKFTGDWSYTVSFFYNQASDYVYQSATGLTALSHHEDEHFEETGHEEEHDEGHEEEGLPVFYFQQSDADIYGMEAEVYYDFDMHWRLEGFGDVIRAKLDNQDLPRTPPLRLGTTLSYQADALSTELNVVWYDAQDNVAPFETRTDGYTLLGANIQYDIAYAGIDWVLFARADNLTDEKARVHTSFLKDQAPLPGRNVSLGVRARF